MPVSPRAGSSVEKLLRRHPLFGELPTELLKLLGSSGTRRTVPAGGLIFAKGDAGSGLFAVLSGTVKISVISVDGQEATFNLIYAGEIFGEIALLDGRPRTADAVAMTDCLLTEIDRRHFLPFVRERPEVAIELIELLCSRLRRGSERIEEMMFLDMPGRLAKTLLRLTDRKGATRDGGRSLVMTQNEISHFVGMSREAVNRQLREWEDLKWVRLERKSIVVLAPKSLAAIAAADFDPDLSRPPV